jgi:hypothetical protein
LTLQAQLQTKRRCAYGTEASHCAERVQSQHARMLASKLKASFLRVSPNCRRCCLLIILVLAGSVEVSSEAATSAVNLMAYSRFSPVVLEATSHPAAQPTVQPTAGNFRQPTSQPSSQPSAQPTGQPTSQPTVKEVMNSIDIEVVIILFSVIGFCICTYCGLAVWWARSRHAKSFCRRFKAIYPDSRESGSAREKTMELADWSTVSITPTEQFSSIVLGAGSFGTVIRARYKSNKVVAVKIITRAMEMHTGKNFDVSVASVSS